MLVPHNSTGWSVAKLFLVSGHNIVCFTHNCHIETGLISHSWTSDMTVKKWRLEYACFKCGILGTIILTIATSWLSHFRKFPMLRSNSGACRCTLVSLCHVCETVFGVKHYILGHLLNDQVYCLQFIILVKAFCFFITLSLNYACKGSNYKKSPMGQVWAKVDKPSRETMPTYFNNA